MTAPRYKDCRCGHSRADHAGELSPQCEHKGCICIHYRPIPAPAARPAVVASPFRPPTPDPEIAVSRQWEAEATGHAPDLGDDPDGDIEGYDGPITPAPEPKPEPEPEPAVRGEKYKPRDLEQLLREGKTSPFKRTVQLAEKIAVQLVDLRGRLSDEREHAAELRAQQEAEAEARKEIAELERKLAEAKAKLRGKHPAAAPTSTPASPQPKGEYVCPECGDVKDTPQGRGAHRAKKHGYRRAS